MAVVLCCCSSGFSSRRCAVVVACSLSLSYTHTRTHTRTHTLGRRSISLTLSSGYKLKKMGLKPHFAAPLPCGPQPASVNGDTVLSWTVQSSYNSSSKWHIPISAHFYDLARGLPCCCVNLWLL
uniref:Putative secreted protein n=1 Tax=Anopheles marajoara TaxID=58244 RepID=A0A2M4C7E1_9DIPT